MSTQIHGDVREKRLAGLYASDAQLQALTPLPAVLDAARRPGVRLAELLRTFLQGYAERPALGSGWARCW